MKVLHKYAAGPKGSQVFMKRSYSGKQKTPPRKALKRTSRIPRELSNNRVHVLKRQVDGFTTGFSAVVGTAGAFIFRLNSVPGSAELTSMYDQYKICGVKITFFPGQTQSSTVALADQVRGNARFLTAIDYNDGTPPANADELRQYESCKVHSYLDKVVRYIPAPKFVNAGTGQTVADWLATASNTTNWFGLKYFGEPTDITSGGTYTQRIEMCYYLCFKNIK